MSFWVVSVEKNSVKDETMVQKANKWLDLVTSFCDSVKNVTDTVVEKSKELFEGDPLYFYLIDEYTMKPIVSSLNSDSPYPIIITKPADVVPKLLPLMQVSFKAVRLLNGVSGVARCFGFPTPEVPVDMLDKAKTFIGSLDKESSVAEFEKLQTAVQKSSNQDKCITTAGVRGGALRELTRFYAQYDENNHFCELSRVSTADGMSCWTSEENGLLIQEESKQCFEVEYPPESKTVPNANSDSAPILEVDAPSFRIEISGVVHPSSNQLLRRTNVAKTFRECRQSDEKVAVRKALSLWVESEDPILRQLSRTEANDWYGLLNNLKRLEPTNPHDHNIPALLRCNVIDVTSHKIVGDIDLSLEDLSLEDVIAEVASKVFAFGISVSFGGNFCIFCRYQVYFIMHR